MPTVSLRELLGAGVHFGHQTRRWNPKMRRYIFGSKNGIHIIDLQRSAIGLRRALDFVSHSVARGGKVLFVGTKRTAQDIVATESVRAGQFFVNKRWLGGTLTNFKTVKQSIDRLTRLEKLRDDGKLALLTKREALQTEREIAKLKGSLGGIQEMGGLPDVVFVIDTRKEHIAVKEARKLNIPVVAVVDTNCNPEDVDYPIPGNDDALKSIALFARVIADACIEGAGLAKDTRRQGYRTEPQPVESGVEVLTKRSASIEEEMVAAAEADGEIVEPVAEPTDEAAPAAE